MNCPQCNRTITNPTVKFCPGCGFHLANDILMPLTDQSELQPPSSEVQNIGIEAQPIVRKSIVGRVVWSIILMVLGLQGCVATLIMGAIVKYEDSFLGGTVILGIVSVLVLLSGISMLIAACNYKKRASYGFETVEETYRGTCEMCGAQSGCLVYRKVDNERKYMKLCNGCARNNIASCDICGEKSGVLKRGKINDIVGWADMCPTCIEQYRS